MGQHLQITHAGVELTLGEAKFLRLVCTQMTYYQMAYFLGKSPHTIDGYRDHLFHKLNVRRRSGLIMWAIKTGYLQTKHGIIKGL